MEKKDFSFTQAELDDAKQIAYKKIGGKYSVQGFRPGKAPKRLIEQNYGDIFMEEAIQELYLNAFEKYLKDEVKRNLLDYPRLTYAMQEDGVQVTVHYELEPEVKLGAYKGLEIEKKTLSVGDKDVEKYLKKIAESRAKQKAADGGHKIAEGNIAVIDFKGKIDGEYFEGGSADNYEIIIGSHTFIDNFEEQLLGLKAGDKKEVDVHFPKDYHMKDYAGKPASFEVEVKSIFIKDLPKIDDEFAKEVSPFDNLHDYKDDIKKKLTEDAKKEEERDAEDRLYEEIMDNAEVEIPDKMIDAELNYMLKDYISASSDTEFINGLKKRYEDVAKRNVKLRLVMNAIKQAENLKNSEIVAFVMDNNKIVDKKKKEGK
ncbi:MAG: trigger factor [Christensenellaceae bacterium]|nr:trigger factor [Christensenellaceae bacterium]